MIPETTFRWVFVILYAFIAVNYNHAVVDVPHLLAYVLGCAGAYVIAVNLPPWIRTLEEGLPI